MPTPNLWNDYIDARRIFYEPAKNMYYLFFFVCLRDAPFDIWGGGGARVFVACNFFFTSGGKQVFFLAINVRQFFFYVMSKNFFVVCFPYYVRYHLVFFLVNMFFLVNIFLHPTDQGWYHPEGSAMLFPAIVPQSTPLAPAYLLKLSMAVVVKIYVQARGTVVRQMD